ncbi:serine/threonine-protein kinase [Psychrobacter cibarius]|nr:serine/threonine-protein kinase [Psychrobacter cibarius]
MIGPHERDDIVGERYQIEEFVDQGGMQFVYSAYDKTLNNRVALKTPKNPSAEKRFHRSAVVSAKVNHPNVAKTLDYFEVGDRAYLVEELVIGGDMSKTLLKEADYLDPFLVAKLFHYLAKGLAASHHANVIHRDLKPTNIMIVGGFQLSGVKITDFGIAKMAAEELTEAVIGGEETITVSATALGALPYMSPEAIDTPKDVGIETDIWSLGAMMYELLTGTKPFGSGLKVVKRILDADYDAFPEFITANPQFSYLSTKIVELIQKCLSLDSRDRPTADELVTECGLLCYPIRERHFGTMRPQNSRWGFVDPSDNTANVFYHVDCIYGARPQVGEKVMLSKYEGSGAYRALPLVRMKQ